jgi:hypothetical protein
MHAELSLTLRAEDPANMALPGICGAQPGNPLLPQLLVKVKEERHDHTDHCQSRGVWVGTTDHSSDATALYRAREASSRVGVRCDRHLAMKRGGVSNQTSQGRCK